jgi:hypothetical protein
MENSLEKNITIALLKEEYLAKGWAQSVSTESSPGELTKIHLTIVMDEINSNGLSKLLSGKNKIAIIEIQ